MREEKYIEYDEICGEIFCFEYVVMKWVHKKDSYITFLNVVLTNKKLFRNTVAIRQH